MFQQMRKGLEIICFQLYISSHSSDVLGLSIAPPSQAYLEAVDVGKARRGHSERLVRRMVIAHKHCHMYLLT